MVVKFHACGRILRGHVVFGVHCVGSLLFIHFFHVRIFCRRRENVLNVNAGLSRSLEVADQFVEDTELPSLFLLDLTRAFKVGLAAYKEHCHAFSRVLLDLLKPVTKILEGLLARDVKGQEDDLGTAVEDSRD